MTLPHTHPSQSPPSSIPTKHNAVNNGIANGCRHAETACVTLETEPHTSKAHAGLHVSRTEKRNRSVPRTIPLLLLSIFRTALSQTVYCTSQKVNKIAATSAPLSTSHEKDCLFHERHPSVLYALVMILPQETEAFRQVTYSDQTYGPGNTDEPFRTVALGLCQTGVTVPQTTSVGEVELGLVLQQSQLLRHTPDKLVLPKHFT